MNILITGVTGFIGSELAKHLIAAAHKVYGLVREDKFSSNLVEGVIPIKGDLTFPATLNKAITKSQPDIIIHTAAFTPVRFSFNKPIEYATINYIGTVNLVQVVIESKIKLRQFIHASTMECYKSKEELITEKDPLFGSTPYGISKVAADHYMQMTKLAYDLPVTILRASNTFGRPFSLPEEARGYLVEKAIMQMINPESTIAEFDGYSENTRTWLYAPDHVSGYLTVFDNEKAIGEVFNISQNNPKNVGEVVNKIAMLTGYEGEIKWGVNPRPYDPLSLCTDGSNLMKLGWKAKNSLDEGLKKTIESLRRFFNSQTRRDVDVS